MAKRFTDTGKWKKEFIKGLPAKYKLLWFYILDDCDHAGMWEVDFEVASLRIGEKVGYDDSFIALGSQFEVVGKNRWWIRDFISFQYGNLTPKNKMYEPVMAILKKYNITYPIPHPIEHLSPIDGVKVKDKDKVKDKVEEKVKVTVPSFENLSQDGFTYQLEDAERKVETIEEKVDAIIGELLTDEIYIEQLRMTHRGKDIKQAFQECYIHFMARPSPPQELWEWKQKLNTWLTNTRINGTSKKGESVNSRREGFAKRHS